MYQKLFIPINLHSTERINMKNIFATLIILMFTSSAFAGSCPMIAAKINSKIAEAQKLHDEGMEAHKSGNHTKSEELLNKALNLFKS
tara:strand:- start:367 stop:627 length:261 start_codon:yes stop_codon:yes gene_type:complete